MPLTVYTARITYSGPDRLDITRKGLDPVGRVFAPSFELLRKYHAAWGGRPDWESYVRDYTEQMRRSYTRFRADWDAILARPRVTLCCYCTDPERCHRTVLAGILAKLGAEYRGER